MGRSTFKVEKGRFVIEIKFKNSGQTPASNVRYASSDAVCKPSELVLKRFDDEHLFSRGDMAPGQEVSTTIYPEVTPDNLEVILKESETYFCYGVLRYKDVFGYERRTVFRLQAYVIDGAFKDTMLVSTKGNCST